MMLPCLGNNRYLWHQSVNIRQTAVTGCFYRHINAKGLDSLHGIQPFLFLTYVCLLIAAVYFTTIFRPLTMYRPGFSFGAASFTVVLRNSTTPFIEQIVTRVSLSANIASSPLTTVVVP